MADLEKLIVSLQADLRQHEKEMARAQGITTAKLKAVERQAEASLKRIDNSFGRLGSSIKRHLAAALTIGAITGAVTGMRELIGEVAKLGDLADRTGTSTDLIQDLEHAAVQADMDFQELNRTMLKFSRNVGEAAHGQGALLKIFRENGKAITGDVAKDLATFADLVKSARNETDALALVYDAFGKGSDAWVEILKDGNAGLIKFGQEVDDTGARLDKQLIQKGQKIDDEFAALMLRLTRLMKGWAVNTAAAYEELWNTMAHPKGESAAFTLWRKFHELISNTPVPFSGDTEGGLPKPPVTFGKQPSHLGTGKYFQPETIVPDPEKAAAAAAARREAAAAAEREAEQLKKVVEQLEFEYEQMRKSELQQKIDTELRRAGTTAMTDQGKEIVKTVTAMHELTVAQERNKMELDALADAQQKATDQMAEDAIKLRDAFKDAFTDLIQGARDGKIGLQELLGVLDSLASKLIQMAAEKLFMQILGYALGAPTAPAGTPNYADILMRKASGGPVAAGKPYMVGEEGPELFQPSSSGNILPAGSFGQSAAPIINITNMPGVSSQQSRSSSGGHEVVDIINSVVEKRFPELLNRNAGLIGAKPTSRRTY